MRVRPWTLLALACLLFLVGCDHATKYAAEASLRGEAARPVVGDAVTLEYHANHGVAFNTERVLPAAARMPVVFAIGFAASALLGLALWRRRGRWNAETVALLLIAAGAMGNLGDRVVRGHVIDFIHVRHWPVFNLADVWLVAGAALMMVAAWRAAPKPR
jgi:signal peptidase II